MLRIDDDALRFLAAELRRGGAGQGVVLRLVADDGGCELVPDRLRDWDRIYDYAGRPIVVADPDTAARLGDRRLTVEAGSVELHRDPGGTDTGGVLRDGSSTDP